MPRVVHVDGAYIQAFPIEEIKTRRAELAIGIGVAISATPRTIITLPSRIDCQVSRRRAGVIEALPLIKIIGQSALQALEFSRAETIPARLVAPVTRPVDVLILMQRAGSHTLRVVFAIAQVAT